MSNDKKVLKNTADNSTNKDTKGGASDIGSEEVFKEAIKVETEVAEQTLYDEPMSNALIAQQEAVINSQEAITIEKMRLFAREVIKSGVSSFKREADVIVVLIRGRELGLPYGVSVNNIFAINGKTGMSVHLHKAMLQNAKVYFELTEDYVPVYAYGIKTEKGFTPLGTTTSTKVDGFQVSPAIIDRQTTYYFEREVKMPLSGEIRIKKVTMSYRYSEALQAELTDKEVWKKYTRSLMKARAFTSGASEIASDVIQGMYGINELAMEFGTNFKIDENLQETIIIDTEHEDID